MKSICGSLFSLVFFCLISCAENPAPKKLDSPVQFVEVTDQVGLAGESAWKYGGPSIADLNADGRYEFLLGNHDEIPAQLFWANEDNTFSAHSSPIGGGDVHGISAGDYDLDGDVDIAYALGGGNGLAPRSSRILRHESNGEFVDVTVASGISEMGARGRSVRWIDLNSDGYLDLLQISAAQLVGGRQPRNLLFENQKDGTFIYRSSPDFENLDAERVLITDFNSDHIPDLVVFTPLGLWQGNNDFTFTDVTNSLLPEDLADTDFVNAVAEADIDNDGDLDLYLARGKTHYLTADNAISFDPKTGRLDLRDEGNKSHDGISFKGSEEIKLSDFYHWPRGVKIELPVYLGKDKIRLETPTGEARVTADQAAGFPDNTSENGWFLGYMGDGLWRLEWNLSANLAWDIRASIEGVGSVIPDWTPQQLGVPDILLRNDNDRFTDISEVLPSESFDNNWGVTNGDFNNDGRVDFFVYRFGELIWRVPDVLVINDENNGFISYQNHGANVIPEKSHGDMGSAFDFDLDGHLDILSGDDDSGRWRLYKNIGNEASGNSLLVHIGYSENGIDPMGAEIEITTSEGKQFKRVGSAGAVHSQGLLNIVHFGLGSDREAGHIRVRWRDGSTEQVSNVKAQQKIVIGVIKALK